MDWDDVRYFLALARLGSVRAAGTSLGVSHSTVARRVEALEAQLSARLFDRNREGYSLTEAGQQMLTGAERVEREMSSLERGLLGQDERLSGAVSLTCCDNYVAELLLKELRGFCENYPEIELCLTTDSRAYDLAKREADIAIRTLPVGCQPPEFLIGQKLVPVKVANYVSISHANELDPELSQSQPRWLSFEQRKYHETMVAQSSYPRVPLWGAFSSLELLVNAACQGFGLAMLPSYVGDQEPRLRRLHHSDLRHVADLWMLSHPDLRDNARFRATRSYLAEAVKRHSPIFYGERWSTDATGCPKNESAH